MKLKKALLTTAGIYAAISGFIYYEAMNRNGKVLPAIDRAQKKKSGENAPVEDERLDWMKEQEFESHFLINGRGQKLQGWYLPAAEKTDKFVLFSHGYRSRGRREFRFMAKFYHDAGFNLFMVDHQASGDSEGEFISFGYHESADMLQWLDYMTDNFGKDIEIVLQGMSMGSATVMMLAGSPDLPENVKFVVADCGYTDLTEQLSYALKTGKIPAHPIVDTANLIQKTFFGFPFAAVRPISFVRQARVPMLFIHGGRDQLVPCYMAQELYDACPTEKDLLIVPDARHTMSYRKDSASYEAKVLEFCERYLKKAKELV